MGIAAKFANLKYDSVFYKLSAAPKKNTAWGREPHLNVAIDKKKTENELPVLSLLSFLKRSDVGPVKRALWAEHIAAGILYAGIGRSAPTLANHISQAEELATEERLRWMEALNGAKKERQRRKQARKTAYKRFK